MIFYTSWKVSGERQVVRLATRKHHFEAGGSPGRLRKRPRSFLKQPKEKKEQNGHITSVTYEKLQFEPTGSYLIHTKDTSVGSKKVSPN